MAVLPLLTREGAAGAGRDHAVVVDLVVQRVRPARGVVLVHRHRGVVREVVVVQHLEHAVTADLKGRWHFSKIIAGKTVSKICTHMHAKFTKKKSEFRVYSD